MMPTCSAESKLILMGTSFEYNNRAPQTGFFKHDFEKYVECLR